MTIEYEMNGIGQYPPRKGIFDDFHRTKTELLNHLLIRCIPPSSFTGKERDEETGYGYFGARYMDYELMTGWLSVDPMADKYPSISPYAYCAWNPVKLVDPDGRDWYESEDGKRLAYFHGETGQLEGYNHIGEKIDKDTEDKFIAGHYSNIYISANFTESDFVMQKPRMCCAAANKMRTQRGGSQTSYANELPVVINDGNGRAGTSIMENFLVGLSEVSAQLQKGIPVVAGMDYKEGSPNSDGVTDHYVAITSISMDLTFNNGGIQLVGGFLGYANPGSSTAARGISEVNNRFTFNMITGKASNTNDRVLCTLRIK